MTGAELLEYLRTTEQLEKVMRDYLEDRTMWRLNTPKTIEHRQNEVQRLKELHDKREYIKAKIMQLEQPYQGILYSYYVKHKTWEAVATEQHYSMQYIFRLKKRAIAAFEELLAS